MSYLLNKNSNVLQNLEEYTFESEGKHKISPQEILAKHPQLISDLSELEINALTTPFISREFPTSRGPVDILYITSDSDIILVETKLLRNSESHRAVVAQLIDYAKALTKVPPEDLVKALMNSKYSDGDFIPDDYFLSSLDKNLTTGNFKCIIAGDHIHPNVLGMVDSIQAAPHLSFTVFLVEISTERYDKDSIFITPRIVSQTHEVERSVIRLEISSKGDVEIDSEIPDKEGQGSKPKISSTEYIQSIEDPDFAKVIQEFWKKWKDLKGDIRFGTVGFSAGMMGDGKRKAIQFVYQDKVNLLSEKWRTTLGISDSTYNAYKTYIQKNIPDIYDRNLVGNRLSISFDTITSEDLSLLLAGAFEVVDKEYGIK